MTVTASSSPGPRDCTARRRRSLPSGPDGLGERTAAAPHWSSVSRARTCPVRGSPGSAIAGQRNAARGHPRSHLVARSCHHRPVIAVPIARARRRAFPPPRGRRSRGMGGLVRLVLAIVRGCLESTASPRPQQVYVTRVLVHGAARVPDQIAIAEVRVQIPILRAQEPCPGDAGERDDVLVVRDAQASTRDPCGLGLNFLGCDESDETRLRPYPDLLGSPADRFEFVTQAASDDQDALSVVDPLPEREEFRVGWSAEEAASHVGIDDGAHLSRRRGSGAARRGRIYGSPRARR